MSIITIILIITLIPTVQLARSTIKLTFSPDIKYIRPQQAIEIQCEILNPNQSDDTAQLWYVDLKTGISTQISRSLLSSPTNDSPDIFKSNRNKRYEYVRKNHIRIRSLQTDDSAKYECNCPDCVESIPKQTRELQVMKLTEPKWIIDSGWPLHENTKTTIKCQIDDFYPYIGHKILRDHQEITTDGKSSLSNSNTFSQKFIWETAITPTAEWHNSTLRCIVTEGNIEQQTTKTLDVLFGARFGKCEERQYVDYKRDQSTIECSYSGNPQPRLTWLRQTDRKPITSDTGITLETKDETNGKYKSIVTFDRNKLTSIPMLTTTTTTTGQEILSGENYYQQLLNNGFTVRLTTSGQEKATRNINIVRDANQVRSKLLNSSIKLSFSSILLSILLILHILQR